MTKCIFLVAWLPCRLPFVSAISSRRCCEAVLRIMGLDRMLSETGSGICRSVNMRCQTATLPSVRFIPARIPLPLCVVSAAMASSLHLTSSSYERGIESGEETRHGKASAKINKSSYNNCIPPLTITEAKGRNSANSGLFTRPVLPPSCP
jgi:hypothetical protein